MEDIARWLANDEHHNGVKELFAAFCQQIVRSGMPVGRASLGLEVLHPEASGWQLAEAHGLPQLSSASRRTLESWSQGGLSAYISRIICFIDSIRPPASLRR